jgi:hypothetical protein
VIVTATLARVVVFKDEPLSWARPDLAVRTRTGVRYRDREGLFWTDPFKPEVRRYNIGSAVEAAAAGFDDSARLYPAARHHRTGPASR